MPNWGYSSLKLDEMNVAKASGRDLRISPKAAREICNAIRYKQLDQARQLLEDVVKKRRAIPYKRYNKKVSHKAGIQGWDAGRYPVKAAAEILKILNSLEANAIDREMEAERLKIVHAAAQRGRQMKRYIPRAFGRSSPSFNTLCHVELAVMEMM
jgi:large subunit ribosomal protein L22